MTVEQAEGAAGWDAGGWEWELGNRLLTQLIDCIRRGDRLAAAQTLAREDRARVVVATVGNDLGRAKAAFDFMAPQFLRAGMDGGLPWGATDKVYGDYRRAAAKATSAPGLDGLHARMVVELADLVRRGKGARRPPPLVARCQAYVNDHLAGQIKVQDVARALRVSPSYLQHAYKAACGETLGAYIRRQKLSKGKQMLERGACPLSDIAAALGYCSQSHFGQAFRKATGVTPREYREQAASCL
jgi:AraC-like DNA-binding protein